MIIRKEFSNSLSNNLLPAHRFDTKLVISFGNRNVEFLLKLQICCYTGGSRIFMRGGGGGSAKDYICRITHITSAKPEAPFGRGLSVLIFFFMVSHAI